MSLFTNNRGLALRGGIDYINDDLKVLLHSSSFVGATTYRWLSDINPSNIVATSSVLSGRTIAATSSTYSTSNGIYFDANDVLFPDLTGVPVGYAIIYKDTGNPATSPLLHYFSFNFTPVGVNVTVQWPGSSIFVFRRSDSSTNNDMYRAARTKILQGDIDLSVATLKAALISTAPVNADFVNHTFFSDISAGLVAEQTLTGVSISDSGQLIANNVLFPLLTGSTVNSVVIYRDTGNPATSDLIFRFSSTSSTGLPFTPTGINAAVVWNNSGQIFQW